MTSPPTERARRSFAFRPIAVVFLVLLVVGFGLGIVVYQRYVAYDAVSARHVPDDVTCAVRFDLTHVMLYEPFRRSIFPLVDRLGVSEPTKPRSERLAAQGVHVGSQVREVAIALGPLESDWVLVIGGKLPHPGLARALAEVFESEGRHIERQANAYSVTGFGPSPVAFDQADDGALILASSTERLERALAPRPALAELSEGAGGLLFEEPWLRPPLRRLSGHFRAGSVVQVRLVVDLASPVNAGMAERVLRVLLERATASDPALAQVARTSVISSEGGALRAELGFPREAVERLAERAAEALERSAESRAAQPERP